MWNIGTKFFFKMQSSTFKKEYYLEKCVTFNANSKKKRARVKD